MSINRKRSCERVNRSMVIVGYCALCFCKSSSSCGDILGKIILLLGEDFALVAYKGPDQDSSLRSE
ncbi:MAG: hypothetical protein FWH18_07615 [Marinilabiliaceae bacterium]|nr:hypothetical protein [Marinilabiliaceae bacterium]